MDNEDDPGRIDDTEENVEEAGSAESYGKADEPASSITEQESKGTAGKNPGNPDDGNKEKGTPAIKEGKGRNRPETPPRKNHNSNIRRDSRVKSHSVKPTNDKLNTKANASSNQARAKPKRKISVRPSVRKEREQMAKKATSQRQKRSYAWIWIIVAILIIAGAVYLLLANRATQPKILATVNGEPIFQSEVDSEIAQLPTYLQGAVTQDEILNQIIEEKLLLQEVKNNGINITDEQVAQTFEVFKKSKGMTDEQVSAVLQEQNITEEYLFGLIRTQLAISELLNRTVISKVTYNQSDLEQYYLDHKEIWYTPQQARVRHILILVNDNRTDEQAKEIIEQIADDITDSTFCEYVTNYTEDAASIFNCGTYTYDETTQFDPSFKQAGFDLDVGDRKIVKSQFGYHLVESLMKADPKKKLFIEVKDKIIAGVTEEKGRALYAEYIDDLKGNSKIVNYLQNPELPQPKLDSAGMVEDKAQKAKAEPEATDTSAPISPPGDATADAGKIETVAIPAESNDAETETQAPEQENVTQETPIAPVTPAETETTETTPPEPATQNTTEPTETTTTPPSQIDVPEKTPEQIQKEKLDSFVKCLTEKGVKVYSRSVGCKYCESQMQLFGDSSEYLSYVECANSDDPTLQTDQCIKAQVTAYPTWVVDGYQYKGVQKLETLASLSGCSLG